MEFHILGFTVWIITTGNSLLISMQSLSKLVPKLIFSFYFKLYSDVLL